MAAAATGAADKVAPIYRFYRRDFGPLITKPLHLDLTFDIREEAIRVTATTTFLHTVDEPLTVLKLNSKELSIESVEIVRGAQPLSSVPSPADFIQHVASFKGTTSSPCEFEVDTAAHYLNVTLPTPLQKGEQLVLRTVSVAKPTAHILEGFYYDYTPQGQPKTIITQCQQYGFQRMVPSLDWMTAKAYYTTRLIADRRYTHMISNGDLAPGFVDPQTGAMIRKEIEGDSERVMVEYHNHKVNMASYLFFLGVGTYESYAAEFEYCDGYTATAELLVFPKLVSPHHVRSAVKSLVDSIYWCYLSCGPEATEHNEERAKIYELIPQRDALKALKESNPAGFTAEQAAQLAAIRAELKSLISVWQHTGYQYTAKVYREISMQNSDYGGMENVQNTTILASRMVPGDLLPDPGYIYMEGVKIHEYYHNINGSQVTGESPFEIWLNEAVTVFIQRQREDVLFGADYMRLKEVLYSFTPGQGPLAIDASDNAMPIEPRGFNRTQELISAMTYSKAPEFVSMVDLMIGRPAFNRGLHNYYEEFAYSNATTDDWIRSMEKASGQSLMPMANLWLRRSGHPHVIHSGAYDAEQKTYTVEIEQTRLPKDDPTPWIFPIDYSLVKDGVILAEGIHTMTQVKETLTIRNINEKPDFLSFARGWSFFGTHANASASVAELSKQALTDPDVINRYFSYRAIVDAEKAIIIEKLLKKDTAHTVSDDVVKLHAAILFDEKVNAGARASILREGEDIHTRPDLSYCYWEISDAKMALLQAIYDAHAEQVLALYRTIEGRNRAGPHIEQIHDRSLKQHLFLILAAGNSSRSILSTRVASPIKADISGLARSLLSSPFMSDQLFAFGQFMQGPADADAKAAVMEEVKNKFASHPDSTETYIGVLTGLDSDDAPSIIRKLIRDPIFNVALAGHARTAVRMWAGIRKRSLLTDDGRALTVELFAMIGKVNQYSAQSFIAALNDLSKFPLDQQRKIVHSVREMYASLDPVAQESLYNQLTATLAPYKDL